MENENKTEENFEVENAQEITNENTENNKKNNKTKRIVIIISIILLIIATGIIGYFGYLEYKQFKLEEEVDRTVMLVEKANYNSYLILNQSEFTKKIEELSLLEQYEAWIKYLQKDISNLTTAITNCKIEQNQYLANTNSYNLLQDKMDYYQISINYSQKLIENWKGLKQELILFYKNKITHEALQEFAKKASESANTHLQTYNSEIKTKGLEYLLSQENNEESNVIGKKISLFDLVSVEYIDFTLDSTPISDPSSPYFQALTISRVRHDDYEELLYVYSIVGPRTPERNSQYAYTTLDTLLQDISWVGSTYSYLKSNNKYEATVEYEKSGPSPIDGISQKEYDDIKNGKYPNVQIIDGDNKDNQIIEENPNSDNEPVTFSMLYLLGYSEERAISLLEASGLKANIVYSSDTEARYGTVISQSINPDEPVKEGETITITISNRVKESELTLEIWLSHLVPQDTDTANVTIIINGEIVMDKNVTLKKNVTSDANNLTENFYVSNETQVQVLVNGKIVYTCTKDFGVDGDCDFLEAITDFSSANIMKE